MGYFDVFQKDDYLKVLADAAADTVFTPSMIETYSRGSGKHYTFGGNDEINGHLAEWQKMLPTFEIIVDCSIGGLDRGDGMCGITVDWFYGSTADRDAAQAKFAWLTGIAKQHNVMSFCTIDRGDCGMRMLFIAGSTADWKAVNDFAATDADFGPTVVGTHPQAVPLLISPCGWSASLGVLSSRSRKAPTSGRSSPA